MALGQWSLQLRKDTPRSVLDALAYFGHVAVTTGRVQPALLGDSLLKSARYVGVLTGATRTDTTAPVNISGPGMAFWLGDANDKGSVYETPVNLVAATFAASITALLPSSGAVTAGTIGSVAGALTQSYVWTSPRTAITSVCQLMGGTGTAAAEWRVNGDATLDAGTVASLYVTNPVAALVRRNTGADQTIRAMHGVMQNAGDVNDYSTRAVVLAAGSSGSTAVGSANAAVVPYKDLHGNTVKLTRMASQSSTDPVNAAAAAAGVLALYNSPRNAVQLSTDEFDLKGTVSVGDYVWVQDPDSGLVDYAQEIHLRGEILTPVLMRVVELDWPVVAGYGAAYRDLNGVWTDLTDYLMPESGATNVVVGSTNRPLTAGGEPIGSRPIPDPTIPATPVFGAFSTSSYVGPSDGKNKAQIQAVWSIPLNTDGSTVIDGDHYEIQYRPDLGIFQSNPSHNQIASAGYTHNTLAALGGTLKQLIPVPVSQWKVTYVAWGTNQVLIQELTPGVNYDFQIRAVDTASPPNQSAWSATTTFQAAVDTIAPPTPDAPTVAANLISVQVSWDCGQAGGGTFNQDPDLHHIEVHGSYDPLFAPSSATKLGLLPATIANISGLIPVLGSFTIPPNQPPAQNMYVRVIAVDITGNKSNPSPSAGASAALLSNAYITDLSVSKLTAGTVTATMILASSISTATSGPRVSIDGATDALYTYDANSALIGVWAGQSGTDPSTGQAFGAGWSIFNDPSPGFVNVTSNIGNLSASSPAIHLTGNPANSTSLPGLYSLASSPANAFELTYFTGAIGAHDTNQSKVFVVLGSGSGTDASSGALQYQNVNNSAGRVLWDKNGVTLTQGDINGTLITGNAVQSQGLAYRYLSHNVVSGTTNASGQLTLAHGAPFTPVYGFAMPTSGNAYQLYLGSFTSTNMTVTAYSPAGVLINTGFLNFWVLLIGF